MGKIKESCIIIREMGDITLKFKELNGRMNNDNHKELFPEWGKLNKEMSEKEQQLTKLGFQLGSVELNELMHEIRPDVY